MQPQKTVIIDYGMGNLRSVHRKCQRVGAEVVVSGDPDLIARAGKLILPGVGHFANGMKNLRASGLLEVLHHKVLVERTPILGICLGMQLMARYSEEGDAEGLGWFDAEVRRFTVQDPRAYRVPHMGWNTATVQRESVLFRGVPANVPFYFVHSYHIDCHVESDSLAKTDYEYSFTSVIQKDTLYGTQFHPEKSHDWGEQLLRNFIELA
jgi:imidazole glycerol-phosphate synthase subunit HisH